MAHTPDNVAFERPLGVYKAIAAVAKDLAETGLAKGRRNEQQGYAFRGIDDVYNALAPLLAKHQLCMLPVAESREVSERQTQKGGTLFYSIVKVRYDVVSAVDGSSHSITTYGEAMDSGDKSTNKAMSAAYKYAAMQMFCIPTQGETVDSEKDTHADVVPKADAEAVKKIAAVFADKFGVALSDLEARLKCKAAAWTAQHVLTLKGIWASLRDKKSTVEAEFGGDQEPPTPPSRTDALADKVAKKAAPRTTTPEGDVNQAPVDYDTVPF